MGARAQVHIVDTGVYLYTHWGASDLEDTVRKVLSRRARWDDDEYLTRMIFSAMVKDEITGQTGYGIGTIQHADIDALISVNCAEEAVTVADMNGGVDVNYTFEGFISA